MAPTIMAVKPIMAMKPITAIESTMVLEAPRIAHVAMKPIIVMAMKLVTITETTFTMAVGITVTKAATMAAFRIGCPIRAETDI